MKIFIVTKEQHISDGGDESVAFFTNKKDAELAIDDLDENEFSFDSYVIKEVRANEHSQFLRLRLSKYVAFGYIEGDSIYITDIHRVDFARKLIFEYEAGKNKIKVKIIFTSNSLKWAKRRVYDEVKKQAKKSKLLPSSQPKQT